MLTAAAEPSWGSFNPPGASWGASCGQLSETPSTALTGKLSMLAAMLWRRRELPEREVWDFTCCVRLSKHSAAPGHGGSFMCILFCAAGS